MPKLRLPLLYLALASGFSFALPAAAQVVISQVYGAGGNNGATLRNDYVELFNAGGSAVALDGMSLQYASASGTGHFANNMVLLNGGLQPGQYFLVQLASSGASGGSLAVAADQVASAPNLSGSAGKLALVAGSTGLACNGGSTPCSASQLAQILDLLGYGNANFAETAAAPALTASTALWRAGAGCQDGNNNAADFTTAAPAPRHSASALNPCASGPGNAPIVATCPQLSVVAGSTGSVELQASDRDSIVIAAALESGAVPGLALSGFVAAAADGEAARVNLTTTAALAAGSYPVSVRFSNDDGQSVSCASSVTVSAAQPITRIFQIQGSVDASPLQGSTVTTEGVVTAVFPGLSGFYLQDEQGDGDEASSDGVFVYYGSTPLAVSVGQKLRLRATVEEFQGITELSSPQLQSVLGSGLKLVPTAVSLPVAGGLERYEGMLVRFDEAMSVSQNYFQGRYGQLTLAAGGRLYMPTQLHAPGSAEALALAADNAARSIVLDDGSSAQNPNPIPYIGADNTLRAGDTVSGLTGVVHYGLITSDSAGPRAYTLQPTEPPQFQRVNARSAAPQPLAGALKVASFNVLNYFTTLDQSGAQCLPSNTRSDCRGADSALEFTRQRSKIIAALKALDADVLGLIELQRNGDIAAQDLVDGLNAATAPGTYAVVPAPAAGSGSDAIRVGMIYKPSRLSLHGAALTDLAAVHNRPPMAQSFKAANGEKFSVVVSHFKSKGCDGASAADADQHDGQGCFNARRVEQAQALLAFVETLKRTAADPDVLLIGDLNAYGKEDPLALLKRAGFADQLARFDAQTYSYVFDGAAGALDHGLANDSMAAQIRAAQTWHINADEPVVIDYNTEFKPQDLYSATPYRASDHDPLILGLDLRACALPDTRPTVVLGARDSGVSNRVVQGTCSIDDLIEDERSWSSLAAFVSHVSSVSFNLLKAGKISAAERASLLTAAQQSAIAVAP